MKIIDAEGVAASASYADLIEALRTIFRDGATTPVRHHHDTSPESILLLMPCWNAKWVGLKTVMFNGANAARGLSTIQASYLLIDHDTGTAVAMLDGTELTRRRTAAAGALAASYLAREDSNILTIVGAGALAPHFARAHAAVRPIAKINIWNRSPERAKEVAKQLTAEGLHAVAATDLASAVKEADIVTCVTSSTKPVVLGEWLKPGAHLDLAGAFKPSMRETDGEAVGRARVYVDTRDGALAEAGDLIQARDEGRFDFANVQGDLFELCRKTVPGRKNEKEITLFKSCGTALEDLAAAVLVHLRN
ncbi:MAG: ornithine cyclodeaminase family protein [Aestuariivirga sp.]